MNVKLFSEMYHLKNKIQIEYNQVVPDVTQYMLDHHISQWTIDHYKLKILAKTSRIKYLYSVE